MILGEVEIFIEDEYGQVAATVIRSIEVENAKEGRVIRIDGEPYRVRAIDHDEIEMEHESALNQKILVPRLFVRPIKNAQPIHDPDETERDAPQRLPPLRLPTGKGRLSSVGLPVGLVVAAVGSAYRQIADDLNQRRAEAAELVRQGKDWYLAPDATPEALHALSRDAVHYHKVLGFILGELVRSGEAFAISEPPSSPEPAEALPDAGGVAAETPSLRPGLRLVPPA